MEEKLVYRKGEGTIPSLFFFFIEFVDCLRSFQLNQRGNKFIRQFQIDGYHLWVKSFW